MAPQILAAPTRNGHSRTTDYFDRTPPSDRTCEEGVLGALLLDPTLFDEAAKSLRPDDFFHEEPRELFRAMQYLSIEGQPLDSALLLVHLRESAPLADHNWTAYLLDIGSKCPVVSNWRHYLSVVKEKSGQRKLLDSAIEIYRAVFRGDAIAEIVANVTDQTSFVADDTGNSKPRFTIYTAEQFDAEDFDVQFAIKNMMVRYQVLGIIAAKKSMKTSTACDLAVSLATGLPFLGYFEVLAPGRVLIMTGESGMGAIQDTMRRVCQSKGITFAESGVLISPDLPSFGNSQDLFELRRMLIANDMQDGYLLVDPVYLCVDGGGHEGNLFVMGKLLRAINELCVSLKITLILVHHTKKQQKGVHQPGELDDASWAGFAEYFRQWMNIARREDYEPGGEGLHRLYLSGGGSVGHSFSYGLDIFEGKYDGPGTRVWQVKILDGLDIEQDKESRTESAKSAKFEAQCQKDMKAIIEALRDFPEGETKSAVRAELGWSSARISPPWQRLRKEGHIVDCKVKKLGRNEPHDGCKLSGNAFTLD